MDLDNHILYNLTDKQQKKLITLLKKFELEGANIGEFIQDIENSLRYNQKRRLKEKVASEGRTTVPKENYGVHETHCCSKHGCKYGDADCPVSINLIKQRYPCEYCRTEIKPNY